MTEYETKDSGARDEFESGMVRDVQSDKPDFSLMFAKDMPYDEQFITRFAALLTRGAVKYSARNWEKADSQVELDRFLSSASRHFMQYITGETDEDHAAAVAFNLMGAEYVKYKMRNKEPDIKIVDVVNRPFKLTTQTGQTYAFETKEQRKDFMSLNNLEIKNTTGWYQDDV